MSVAARYSGTCPDCGGRWQPGDLIRATETNEHGESLWQHAVCPDDVVLAASHPVCYVCWLAHPNGACDR